MKEETKKPRARARGSRANGRTRGSEAAVARTGLALQIEADVGIRIGTEVLVADDDVLAVLRRGLGHDRRGERGRERRKSNKLLHDVAPVFLALDAFYVRRTTRCCNAQRRDVGVTGD